MSFNKLTGDFELVEVEGAPPSTKTLTELDYLCLITGARDYDYLMEKNKFQLDNEVTSLFPITSYEVLHFITFLLSNIDAHVNHLFAFKRDKDYGVYSNAFFNTLDTLARKFPLPSTDYVNGHKIKGAEEGFMYYSKDEHIAYNLNNRELSELRLALKPRLNNWYSNEMLCTLGFSRKLGFRNAGQLKFKKEVLLYLPRFYFNVYSRYHEVTRKVASINQLKFMADTTNLHEYERASFHNPLFSKIEKQKLYFSTGMDETQALEFLKGLDISYEELKNRLTGEGREEPITDIYELNEFMIKSILVRRPPTSAINSPSNRTNGVYLLNKGVGKFRQLVLTEIMKGANFEYIHVTDKFIEIKYGGLLKGRKKNTKRKRLPVNEIVDFNNKPTLLNQRFVDLINKVYAKYPIHRVLKFAQVYVRLFNQFGNNGVYYLLGTEFDCLDYTKFLGNISSFRKFEEMLFGKGRRTYPPEGTEFNRIAKKFMRTRFYPRRRYDVIVTKFLGYH